MNLETTLIPAAALGAQIILIAVPVGFTFLGIVLLLNQARSLLYRLALDCLEILARHSALRDDQLKRDIQILEATYHLRQRRLDLQSKRLALLDDDGGPHV